MSAAQTSIPTENASVYLTRLSGHSGKMAAAASRLRHGHSAHADEPRPQVRHMQHDGSETTVILDRGQWTMRAEPGRLVISIQAPDQDGLRRIQDLLSARLRKLARHEQLAITWVAASGLPGVRPIR